MVWDHQKKIIFIHIPKTGGTSIENYMNILNYNNPILKHGYGTFKNISFQHFTYSDYNEFLGIHIFKNYFKFSVIRNPYTRIISEYFWVPDKLKIGYKSNKSFDYFLENVTKIINSNKLDQKYYDHFIPQYKFICDENGSKFVNKIFKFEDFNSIIKFLKSKNYKFNEKYILNKGRNKQQLNLNNKQKNIIYKIYKKDFKFFNYKK